MRAFLAVMLAWLVPALVLPAEVRVCLCAEDASAANDCCSRCCGVAVKTDAPEAQDASSARAQDQDCDDCLVVSAHGAKTIEPARADSGADAPVVVLRTPIAPAPATRPAACRRHALDGPPPRPPWLRGGSLPLRN